MSLVVCLECSSKISDKAISCPQCGFSIKDIEETLLPISSNKSIVTIPVFKYELETLDFNDEVYEIISMADNKNILQEFGKWDRIKTEVPAIAEIINDMAQKDEVLVARMDDYIKN